MFVKVWYFGPWDLRRGFSLACLNAMNVKGFTEIATRHSIRKVKVFNLSTASRFIHKLQLYVGSIYSGTANSPSPPYFPLSWYAKRP